MSEIIGKGGSCIKALQSATGVKITTPNAPTVSGKGPGGVEVQKVRIGLAGAREKVLIAKAAIKDITKYYHSDITHPNVSHEEMDLPTTYFNFIIGAKGAEIKHIQANYKVNVYVPNANSVTQGLLVVGEATNVSNAVKHIEKLIEKYTTPKEPAAAPVAAPEPVAPNPSTQSKSVKDNMEIATKIRKEEVEPEEEWMKEFTTQQRSPIDLNAMLPPSAKFAATPVAMTNASVPADAGSAAATEGVAEMGVTSAVNSLPPGSAWGDGSLGQKISQPQALFPNP